MGILLLAWTSLWGDSDGLQHYARDYGAGRYRYQPHAELPADSDGLVLFLRHPDRETRERAAAKFIGKPAGLIRPVLEAFRKDYAVAGETIWDAIDDLGSGVETRAQRNSEIRRIAETHPDPELRGLAEVLLLETASSPTPGLLRFLADEHPSVRAMAAVELAFLQWKDGSDLAVPRLLSALTDADAGVRRMAAYSLSVIQSHRLEGEDVQKALIRAVHDPAARFNAARAIARTDFGPAARDAAAALTSVLGSSDVETRECIARSLGSLGPDCDAAREALLGLLSDGDRRVGVCSASVLARWGKPSIPSLGQLSREGDQTTRLMAVFAFGEMDPPVADAVLYLVDALSDAAGEVRLEAAHSLAAIGRRAEPAIPALTRLLTDPDPLVRAEAACAIGRVGRAPDETIRRLAVMLADENVNVRLYATLAMAEIGSGVIDARESLLRNLSDAEPLVRVQATLAIRRLPPPLAVPVLTVMLSDSDPSVRHAAARAFGEIGPAAIGAVSHLEALQGDEDHWVRMKVQSALSSIRGGTGRPAE